jgi:hypothetical protein
MSDSRSKYPYRTAYNMYKNTVFSSNRSDVTGGGQNGSEAKSRGKKLVKFFCKIHGPRPPGSAVHLLYKGLQCKYTRSFHKFWRQVTDF